jgi:hypothetical protein
LVALVVVVALAVVVVVALAVVVVVVVVGLLALVGLVVKAHLPPPPQHPRAQPTADAGHPQHQAQVLPAHPEAAGLACRDRIG